MTATQFSFLPETLRQIAHDVLAYAAELGASACETDVSEAVGRSVTVRKDEVETIEYNRDKGLGVTVYQGHQRGHASSSDFSPAAVRATVEAAIAIARHTAADAAAGLPEQERLAKAGTGAAGLDLYHPWDLPVEEAIEIARSCERAAFAVSPLVRNSEGASVSVHHSQFVSANSLGFIDGFATSRHYISCAVIAGDNDHMQRDDWHSSKRAAADLSPPAAIGEYAAQRALSRLKARKLTTRRAPVLFEAPLAAGLIGNFVHAASGGALYRQSSFLVDSLGKQIFSPRVGISERPFLPRGFASSRFDDDGVATVEREVVEDGVLTGYFLSTYTGRKLGMPTTGNAGGCHNLLVHPGRHDFAGLLREMGTGLLVTELLGQGVNYLTGDYSRGAVGYWVEGGEICYPVEEITIAGKLQEMFAGIAAIGNDVLTRGSKQVGSILIEQMTIAGN